MLITLLLCMSFPVCAHPLSDNMTITFDAGKSAICLPSGEVVQILTIKVEKGHSIGKIDLLELEHYECVGWIDSYGKKYKVSEIEKLIPGSDMYFTPQWAVKESILKEEKYKGTWNSFGALDFSGGSGTEEDLFLISTPGELALMSVLVDNRVSDFGIDYSSAFYKQIKDVDLSAHAWFPIGEVQVEYISSENTYLASGSHFKGSFDGNGFVIKGLNISLLQEYGIDIGLFGSTDEAS